MKYRLLTIFIILPAISSAYGVETHAKLTSNAFREYNKYHEPVFTAAQVALAASGAIHEDEALTEYGFGMSTARRPLNHFYDPINNSGLDVLQAGLHVTGMASPLWVIDTKAQATYGNRNNLASSAVLFSGDGDYSWNRAVYEYVHGDKDRAAQALGHVMHVLEDATSPAHTRNDPHSGIAGDNDPYEDYTNNLTPRVSVELSEVPSFATPQSAVQQLALYTNTHFFSRDSVDNYALPQKASLVYKEVSGTGYGINSGSMVLQIGKSKDVVTGSLHVTYDYPNNDPIILTSNWNALSHKAVAYGVGLIDLFIRDVDKERQTHALLDINKSEVQIAALRDAEKLASNFSSVKRLYGSSLTEEDLQDLNGDDWKRNTAIASAYASVTSPKLTRLPLPPTPSITQVIEDIRPDSDTPAEQKTVVLEMPKGSVLTAPYTAPPNILSTPQLIPAKTQGVVLGASIDTTAPALVPAPFTLSGGAGQGGGGGAQSLEPIDTTPPKLALSATGCVNTDADSCLILPGSATLTIVTDGDSFSVDSVDAKDTVHEYVLADGESKTVTVIAKDLAGNTTTKSLALTASASPLIINEVAVGTTEWVELYNTTSASVDLGKFGLKTDTEDIALSGSALPHGYVVIAKGGDVTGVPNVVSYTSSEPLAVVALVRGDVVLDATPKFRAQQASYERYSSHISGAEPTNWNSHLGVTFPHKGKTLVGDDISGTPGERNLTAMNPYNPQVRPEKDYTLSKSNSPYVVYDFSIPKGIAVTVEPGVVIKMSEHASVPVSGTFRIEGTGAEPVLITSLKDDTSGDTNYDGVNTIPVGGDWNGIYIDGGVVTGTFAHVLYGGSGKDTAVRVVSGSLSFTDSEVAHAAAEGIRIENGEVSLKGSMIKDIAPYANQYAVLSRGGTLTVDSSVIGECTNGIFAYGDIAPVTLTLSNNNFSRIAKYPVQLSVYIDPSNISGNSGSDNGINVINGGLQIDSGKSYTLHPNSIPYELTGTINQGASLTIEKGVTLVDATFDVFGTLTTLGESPTDVLFTSLTNEVGSWFGIRAFAGGLVQLSGTTLRDAGREGLYKLASIYAQDATVSIRNSIIEESVLTGIDATNSVVTIADSIIQNIRQGTAPAHLHRAAVQLRGTATYTPTNVQYTETGEEVVQN